MSASQGYESALDRMLGIGYAREKAEALLRDAVNSGTAFPLKSLTITYDGQFRLHYWRWK